MRDRRSLCVNVCDDCVDDEAGCGTSAAKFTSDRCFADSRQCHRPGSVIPSLRDDS